MTDDLPKKVGELELKITQEEFEKKIDFFLEETKTQLKIAMEIYKKLRNHRKEYEMLKKDNELEFYMNKGAPSYRFKNDNNSKK